MGKDRFEDLDFIDFNDSRQQESTVIADMLSAVYRNRKWFILSVVVCVLIGFLYLKSSPKIFLRTATVLVKDEQKGGGVNGAAAFQDLFSLGGSTVDNEVGIFKSKRLMRTVVEMPRLSWGSRRALCRKKAAQKKNTRRRLNCREFEILFYEVKKNVH